MVILIGILLLLTLVLTGFLLRFSHRLRMLKQQLSASSEARHVLQQQLESSLEQHRRLQELQVQLLHERQQNEHQQQRRNLFLASISHEIRTPMSGLLGILTLLDKTSLTSEQQEYVRTLQDSSEHLLAIVSDILDLSRIDANRLEIVEENFSLAELLKQLLALVRPRAEQKLLPVELEYDPAIPTLLRGDPVRIRQILMNYLTNAIKFTDQGRVALQAQVVRRDNERLLVRLLVEDTGIGIAANQAHKLFDEYSFAHGPVSERAGGTGLGLNICRRLATLMGGKVGVISAPGSGSRFWLELPLLVAGCQLPDQSSDAAERASELRTRDPDITQDNPRLEGVRVLLAEDNPVNQTVARKMLQQMGCEVTVAGNGAEALQCFGSGDFDAVLMDCHMPVLDGLEATRQIRALPKPQVPVIALSADVTSEQRKSCLDAGMTEFLSKPVRQEALQRVLQACLSTTV